MGLLKRSSHWKSIGSVIGILYWHYFYIITNIDFFEILVFELNLLLKKFAWIWDFPACLRIHNDNDESADDILQPHHCNRGRAGTQPLARDGVSLRPWEQGWEAWRASSPRASDPRGRVCRKRQITAFSVGPSRPCGLRDVSERGGRPTGWGLSPTGFQTPRCGCHWPGLKAAVNLAPAPPPHGLQSVEASATGVYGRCL